MVGRGGVLFCGGRRCLERVVWVLGVGVGCWGGLGIENYSCWFSEVCEISYNFLWKSFGQLRNCFYLCTRKRETGVADSSEELADVALIGNKMASVFGRMGNSLYLCARNRKRGFTCESVWLLLGVPLRWCFGSFLKFSSWRFGRMKIICTFAKPTPESFALCLVGWI